MKRIKAIVDNALDIRRKSTWNGDELSISYCVLLLNREDAVSVEKLNVNFQLQPLFQPLTEIRFQIGGGQRRKRFRERFLCRNEGVALDLALQPLVVVANLPLIEFLDF